MPMLRHPASAEPIDPNVHAAPERADGLAEFASKLARKIANEPVARLWREDDRLVVEPTGCGFRISVTPLSKSILVTCGGWHDDFYSWRDVERLVSSALAGAVRLTSVYANGKPLRYTLEQRSGDDWVVIGEVEYMRWTLFKPRTTTRRDLYQPVLDQPAVL
jgi:hypothetical protein